MLFDLRGRGRRRTVQVIYVTLALLMGGGLVLFGIGGATSGGLLDAFKGNEQQVDDVYTKRVEQAEATVRVRPRDAKAWAELARVRYQAAGTGDNFDSSSNTFTTKGRQALVRTEQAWDRYLKLTTKPDPTVASVMVAAFAEGALNKPAKAVEAMEIVIDDAADRATPQLYVQLAAYAYQAGQIRKAELAGNKAIELAPDSDKEQIKAQVDAVKGAGSSQSSTTGTG